MSVRKISNRILVAALLIAGSAESYSKGLTFDINKISEDTFNERLRDGRPSKNVELEKVTDLDATKEMLTGRMLLDDSLTIYDPEGHVIFNENYFEEECLFIAYYPQESLISFRCGHESDTLISIEEGEYVYENPESRIYSPDGTYRLTGYYNGQEPSYFIQKNDNGSWVEMKETEKPRDEHTPGFYLYFPENFTWLSNKEFIFSSAIASDFYIGRVE